jgi:peptidoglycan/LPS O-acetylase OafA/YrhL
LAVAAAVLLALSAHRFIERPFLAAMRGRSASARRQGGASAGEAVVAAALLPIAKPQRRH